MLCGILSLREQEYFCPNYYIRMGFIMMKIGCVSLDVSHPKALAGKMEAFCMDMKFEYLWDKGFRTAAEREAFVTRYGLAGEVDEISEMVDKVDMGFVHSCNWEKHLEQAMPFIEAGKPVFIDKPLVGSVEDVKKVRELLAKGAVIYGASSCRYVDDILNFVNMPQEKKGDVVSIYCTVGVDEFNYAIHAVEILSTIAGCKAVSCQYTGSGKSPDGMVCETYNIHFENGIIGTYHVTLGKHQKFHVTVMTTTNTFYIGVDSAKLLVSLLRELYRQWRYGKSNLCDVETLLNCTEVMLCGKKSRDEKNGAVVAIPELEAHDKFDGYAFEKEYAATAMAAAKK